MKTTVTTLKTSTQDDVLILSVQGRLSWDGMVKVGEESITVPFAFRNLIEEQVRNGVKKFVLDLTQCTYVDSSGLGTLVTSYAKVANAKGSVSLVVARESKLYDTLQAAKLFTLFDSAHDSVESALQKLRETKSA